MSAITFSDASTSEPIRFVNVDALPPGFLPFEEFAQQFSLGGTSTEKLCEGTRNLSQVMEGDVVKGLGMLLDADEAALRKYEQFILRIEELSPLLADRIRGGGRIFLIGSGSSGRVAVDIAAKCSPVFPGGQEAIRGIIAGGDSALIRAKEGFEDSALDGAKCLQSFNITPKDTIFLISASGSAPFNVGCGHFGANQGAQVFYFYNSKEIPSRTQELFNRPNNPVKPLELDIGPQAISGSTRLQAASLAELCLGALLGKAILNYHGVPDHSYHWGLYGNMGAAQRLLRAHLPTIAKFVEKEASIFLSPNANFRRLKDETERGYVTVIGEGNTLREILIDATEMSPTFSVNPIRTEKEIHEKREEFRAYLAGGQDNREAWKTLLGRDIEPDALTDVDPFVLSQHTPGQHSFDKRPMGLGNLVIGVAKTAITVSPALLNTLFNVRLDGGETGLIVLSRGTIPSDLFSTTFPPLRLLLENIPTDDFLGLAETILLKQTLNLISNGSMVLAGKVLGNRMVDVRASNNKLIDRSLRMIKEIQNDFQRPIHLSDKELYHLIANVCALKQSFGAEGIYTPSVVKIVLSLLFLELELTAKNFEEVLDFLAEKEERLDFLSTETAPFTFCIDGGGSKTLLQVVDARGKILPLSKGQGTLQSILSEASNINVVGEEGVQKALLDLFDGVKIGKNLRDARELLPGSRVVAGMAGIGLEANRNIVSSLFRNLGVQNLDLLTDAEMAIRLLKGNGVVLIAGTGSICFAENNGVRTRVGGLGRILGDEGSGYKIGLKGIQAAIEEELGYGPPTNLTRALRNFFNVPEVKSLLPRINRLEISSTEIASASIVVFKESGDQDPVAMEIISSTADELLKLVSRALEISKLARCELHLWGGVFKDDVEAPIIDKIRKEMAPYNITVINRSSENGAVAYARMFRGDPRPQSLK